jgi:hypothetical protein
MGFMTIFYCLRFETPPTWRARSPYLYPSETRWPSYTPRHWVPISPLPTTSRATVEVFEPASTPRHGPHRKHHFHYCVLSCCRGNVSTELFPSNACCTVARLHSCYLAMGLLVKLITIKKHVTKCYMQFCVSAHHVQYGGQ